ncbi:MAG: zinc ABC transporter substrate-binding protein [Crocinitomicaceae bacterium]|nr:zinc ABC transporter substrate-binding protein [Flavobacteriales bacterium]NQZ36174.1 zinc ABC transporter substrate-binding protein [Crocinitomicaceae bacterium]
MHKNYFSSITVIIVLVLCTTLFSCQSESPANQQLNIVTTTGMIGDAVSNIVGDSAEVISLMGPGVDPHLYKVTQSDIKKLLNADVIFYNGLHLEGKMGEILEQMSQTKPVIAVYNGLTTKQLRATSEFQGNYDPHIWFSVQIWTDVVKYIGKNLAEIDEDHASFYQANTAKHVEELTSLHSWTAEQIKTIPKEQRVLITAHDAFGYFGREYGMKVKGLQGLSTAAEYGLKDVTNLVNFISENKIKAVFVESSVSDRSIKAVMEGCRHKGHTVKIGGTLYSDAMGAADKPEGTYIGMVKHNVTTIVEALK